MRRPSLFLTLTIAILSLATCPAPGADSSDPTYEELCGRARQLVDHGEYVSAIAAYTQAIQLNPDGPYAYVGRAVAYLGMQRYTDAISDCSKAMTLAEEHPIPVVLRGDIHHAAGESELAIQDYTAAIALDRSRPDVYFKRAEVYLDQNDYDPALRDYNKAVDLGKNDAKVFLGRGQVYCGLGDFASAVADYTQAIGLEPHVARHYFLRAQANFDRESLRRAIEDCDETIRLDAGFAAAFGLRGAAYLANKNFERAIADLNEAARLAPMDAGAFLWLGRAHLAGGNMEKAISALSDAIEIDREYVEAYELRASAYEKGGQLDKAKEDAARVEQLVTVLEQPPGSSSGGRDSDAAPGDPEGQVTSLAKSDRQLSSDLLLLDAVRGAAEEERRKAIERRDEMEACEARSVVPRPCQEADEVFQRSVTQLDDAMYETAAASFRAAQNRYDAALEAFEDVASKTPSLWLTWARQLAEATSSNESEFVTWIGIAEASHLAGDEEGYRSAMQRVVSMAKAYGLTDPYGGATTLLTLSTVQLRCNDRPGAKASVSEAAYYCDGVQNTVGQSYLWAKCAGNLARLGDAAGWRKQIQRALVAAAKNENQRPRHALAWQPHYVKCLAYAEALAPDQALAAAQAMEVAYRKPYLPDLAKWGGPAFAAVALSAAKTKDADGRPSKEFEVAYASACSYLVSFLSTSRAEIATTRSLLAAADAELGKCDRAWVHAANIPSPNARSVCLTRIIQDAIGRGQFVEAIQWARRVPEEAKASNAPVWTAMAHVQAKDSSMRQLKQWATSELKPGEAAIALAGIGAGVATRSGGQPTTIAKDASPAEETSGGAPSAEQLRTFADRGDHLDASQAFAAMLKEHRNNAQVREIFDRSAASVPEWWLQQAQAFAQRVERPWSRARNMLQLARTYQEIGDEAGAAASTAAVVECSTDLWAHVLDGRGTATQNSQQIYDWPYHARSAEEEKANVNVLLNTLIELEDFQHDIGKQGDAIDTLLLALVCAGCLPKEGRYASPATPDSFGAWFARIAGRAQRRGRADVAEVILKNRPWSQVRAAQRTDTFLAGWAAAEAMDEGQLTETAEELRQASIRGRDTRWATYAALLYAQLARIAAERGNQDAFRKAAMTVGGLVSAGGQNASRAILLRLAEAATVAGQADVAREYLRQSGAGGPDRDAVVAQIMVKMLEDGRVVEARRLLEEIVDESAAVSAWYATTKAEVSAPSARLSAVYEEIDNLSSDAAKSAALAGVAAAMLTK